MTKPLHIVRYGTNADQKYFGLDFRECYEVIAVNANMIAFSPDAISTFLGKKTLEKGFFIDPITHAFQHDQTFITSTDGEKIKKSIEKLIIKYGDELKNIVATEEVDTTNEKKKVHLVANRPLITSDITARFISSFTKNVIDFQVNVVQKKEQEYKDYVDFAKSNDPELSTLVMQAEPLFIVAPYFFIEGNNDWLTKNVELINEARKHVSSPKKLFAQIVLSKRVLLKAVKDGYANSDLSKIIGQYKSLDVDGFLIWIDKYKEHDEIAESLSIYIDMLKDLKSSKKLVYSLYGSYFSVILSHEKINLLDGVCHGLEYGESRDVVPVGGGLPMPKYYLPALHKRINFGDMVRVISDLGIKTREEFLQKICNCSVCESVIKSDNVMQDFSSFGESTPSTFKRGKQLVTMSFATTDTKDLSLRHYLANKHKEYKNLNQKKISEISQELRDIQAEYQKYLDEEKISHLEEWIESLKQFSA